MADSASLEIRQRQQAQVLIHTVARALEDLDPFALLEVEDDARMQLEACRADMDRAREQLRLASSLRQVATALVLLKAGADLAEVAETGSLPEPDLPADPIGQQMATLEILQHADEPLSAGEIQQRLGERLGRTPTIAAVQNLLSRMARHEPPLVVRPSRGLYLAKTSGSRSRTSGRTNVRSATRRRSPGDHSK